MKKWFALLLAAVMLFTIAGCGKSQEALPEEIEPEEEVVETPEPETEPEPVVEEEPEPEPETEPESVFRNQLTGEICDEEYQQRRPLAIMINNMTIKEQRVQTGLSHADLILETYIEGYVTRLMAFYKDIEGIGQIGTIRSARIDYARIAEAFDALYIHVGEDPSYCANYLNENGIDDINFQEHSYWFREANGLSTEHTLYSTDELINECITDLDRRTTTDVTDTWVTFREDEEGANPVLESGQDCNTLYVDFSSIQETSFHYNEETGLYERWSCGEELTDYKDGEVTAVKNVFTLATTVGLYDDQVHADIGLSGGEGFYASEGKIVPIKWSTTDNYNFIITLPDGSELPANIGTSYICLHSHQYTPTWE